MKIPWFYILFLIASFSVLSQNMDSNVKTVLSNEVPAPLRKILLNDKTDENLYIAGKYYCHNFASQFFLQNSCLVSNLDNYDFNGMLEDWGVVVTRLASTEKLPIYYVGLWNTESGFYHAINAYLLDPSKPELIESYLFIEPQSDEVFLNIKSLYDKYRRYYDVSENEEILNVSIGTLDAFKNNGTIYQSRTSNLFKFEVKFK